MSIQYKRIRSSQADALGYDSESQSLIVFFKTSTYVYHEVPHNAFEYLAQAKSFGQLFAKLIKGYYQFQKLDDGARETFIAQLAEACPLEEVVL